MAQYWHLMLIVPTPLRTLTILWTIQKFVVLIMKHRVVQCAMTSMCTVSTPHHLYVALG